MANQWVRLWHEMPTDPKWRVIANRSGRSISEVIAVFNFLMISASRCVTERGSTEDFVTEDVAACLDLSIDAIESILKAMQSKVLDGDKLLGWEKRQPKREDSSAERTKEYRERKVTKRDAHVTQCDARSDQIRSDKDQIRSGADPVSNETEKKKFVFNPTDETHSRTITLAPGWDRQALYGKFTEFVRTKAEELPRDPQKAFLGWVPKFTANKNKDHYRANYA